MRDFDIVTLVARFFRREKEKGKSGSDGSKSSERDAVGCPATEATGSRADVLCCAALRASIAPKTCTINSDLCNRGRVTDI